MNYAKLASVYLTFGYAFMALTACADKEMPEAPTSANEEDATASERYSARGAQIGTPEVLKALAECNSKGHFYDRIKNECDKSAKLVDFKCTNFDEAVKGMDLKGGQLESFEDYLKNQFKGYEFDQCV